MKIAEELPSMRPFGMRLLERITDEEAMTCCGGTPCGCERPPCFGEHDACPPRRRRGFETGYVTFWFWADQDRIGAY